MKKNILGIVIILLIAAGVFFAYTKSYKKAEAPTVAKPQDNTTPEKKTVTLKGRIVWGEGARSFQPCGKDQDSVESEWIDGKSPALSSIKSTYEKKMAGSGPYAPMYAEIEGSEVPVPQDGFGADYKKAISIEKLILSDAIGSCKQDLIILENIKPGDYIDAKAPLRLTGKARGNWFFEASFPVQVLDSSANILASGFVSAKGDWMTTEFVPFAGALTFTKAPLKNSFGKIVLKKDNPSDDRNLDDALEVMIYFSNTK